MPATDGLNTAQLEAVVHDRGPLVVLAGPGTGKTRVITRRIAHMIESRGVAPESIVAVTYTTKAAQQLRERLGELIGADADAVHAHTFHGLGMRIIRRFADEAGVNVSRLFDGDGGIIDSAQTTRLLRDIIRQNDLFEHARAGGIDAVVDRVGASMEALANAGISCEQALAFVRRSGEQLRQGLDLAGKTLDQDALRAEIERIRELDQAAQAVARFEVECRESGWLTFGDLITLPIKILRKSGRAAAILRDEWRHVVVDEFQDVNAAQIEMLRLLAPPAAGPEVPGPDICAVGDDDQAIFGFRGADDRAFQRFGDLWPGHAVVRLTQNYRSGSHIVAAANACIGRAKARYAPDKRIDPAGTAPPCPVDCIQLADYAQDAEVIAAMILTDRKEREASVWADYAVVVRTHKDADRVLSALRIEGVPCVAAREGAPADDEGVKDAFAWVELLAAPHTTHAAARILMRPPFSIDMRAFLPTIGRFRAELSRFEAGEPDVVGPGAFADWLAAALPDEPAVPRFVELHAELRRLATTASAAEVVHRIVLAADIAHADLLTARERAHRIANLVRLLKFARERQPRLDPPGDIRAFWSYYQDLSDKEQQLADASLESSVDGPSGFDNDAAPDAVRVITAHTAKGLEFDTVFVPRVTPKQGYGSTISDEEGVLPKGLVPRLDPRPESERVEDELRRLFYVACTRAERRLVLLSPKSKGISKTGRHYFQEFVHDSRLEKSVRVLDAADVLKRAGELGLGAVYGWSRPNASGLDAQTAGFRTVEYRKAVFEQARRDIRTAAAGALDLASSGRPDVAQDAAKTLGDAALRLAILAEAESAGRTPEWADADTRAFGEAVFERAGRDPKAAADDPSAGQYKMAAPLHLSFTRVNDYLTCPRCFYIKHILKLPDAQRAAQVVGAAVHKGLERFYLLQRECESEGTPPPTREQLIELGRAAFFQHWPRYLETDVAQLDQVQAQLGLAFDRLHDPSANVVEVERNVHFAYGPHAFSAKIDRIDRYQGADGREGFRIVDYKTGGAWESLREPESDDLQLGVYALALGHLYGGEGDLPGIAEYWLLSTGQRGQISLADIDRAKVRAQIDLAIDGMLAGRWERGKSCRGGCAFLGAACIEPPMPPGEAVFPA